MPLTGGHASAGVVRVGATVRKPWADSTDAVVSFVEAIRAAGVDAPRQLGRDDRQRQVIEFVPGPLAQDVQPLSLADLARIGRMVREIHDAAAPLGLDTGPRKTLIPAPDPPELICHNDLAPWNLIVGDRWTFIDWDGAGPSTRLWDLAYAAQSFTLNDCDADPSIASDGLAAFVAGYGAEGALRAALPEAMRARAGAMHAHLRAAHAIQWEPWSSMFVHGHGAHWRAVEDYVGRHRELWASALD